MNNIKRYSRQATRGGHTMVETLIVVNLLGLILGITATMMHTMFRADSQSRREIAFTATLDRLSTRYRQDAHAATKVEVKAGDGQSNDGQADGWVRFTMADGDTIEYAVHEEKLRRIKRCQQITLHRDSFRLPRGSRVRFEIEKQTALPLATIHVVRQVDGGKPKSPETTWRVQAAVGLDGLHSEAGSIEK